MTGWGRGEAAYNLRQLRLAQEALLGFLGTERRLADLGNLVSTLDAVNAAIEGADEAWEERFEDQLLTLESAYAVSLDRAARTLDDGTASRVAEAVAELERLNASHIEELERLSGEG